MEQLKIGIFGNCQVSSWQSMIHANFDDIEILKTKHVTQGSVLTDVEIQLISECDLILKVKSDRGEQPGESYDLAFEDREIIEVPSLVFSGFHPDVCYVTFNGAMVKNFFLKDWNSRILYWSFQNGLGVSEALSLFNAEVFEELGYFSTPRISRDQLRENFSSCNFDFDLWMQKVQREGNFMLGPNHPKLVAFSALADQLGTKIGRTPKIPWRLINTYSVDPLANNFVWPVHLPIADYLGIEYSDRVRSGESYLDFEEFAINCYEFWSRLDIDHKVSLVGGSNYHDPILKKYLA